MKPMSCLSSIRVKSLGLIEGVSFSRGAASNRHTIIAEVLGMSRNPDRDKWGRSQFRLLLQRDRAFFSGD
jgi:hypothetical protein